MEPEEILNELTTIFRKELANDTITLKLESTAKDFDGWTSLNHMALISAVEEHYKIRFSLKEVMKFKNVNDMCLSVQSKVKH